MITQRSDAIKELRKCIKAIAEIGKNEFDGVNLFYNFAYREILVSSEVESFFEEYRQDKRVHKEDATSKSHPKIEIKTGTGNLGKRQSGFSTGVKFEFDKQNDEIRRTESVSYDALVFSIIDPNTESPAITAIAKTEKSVADINERIRLKQKDFLLILKESKKANKRVPRDSISFNVAEIFEVPEIIWVKDQKQISKEQARALFYWGKKK
tara:strand:- start:214 stop:843 length:630 start_codon:yes stop_codon:yes gene_type:complete